MSSSRPKQALGGGGGVSPGMLGARVRHRILVNQDLLTSFEPGKLLNIHSVVQEYLCVTYCTNLVVIILLAF